MMFYDIDNTASTSTSTSTFSTSSRQSAVPRLTDLCKRVLKANVAHIVDVGDVPYEMVKDVLFGCRVEQLREIEELSPHIAEEDEEIWEYFFNRDFPIVAEARAKAAAEAANKKELEKTTTTTTSKASQGGGRKASPAKSVHRQHAAAEFRGTDYDKDEDNDDNNDDNNDDDDDDDDLFMSYRDLYYDEQVRREEKLASAGERLKERMNSLAAMKSSRQTILDPRLSLNLRKKRRGQTLPTGRRGTSSIYSSNNRDGSSGSRPKTLTEKARARASQLAFAYEPPRTTRFTRSASMQVGFIPSKPRPSYKEEKSMEDVQNLQGGQATKGIFGPRRDRTMPVIGKLTGKPAITQSNSASHPSRTSFAERTVSRPAKSSMERPHKSSLQLPEEAYTKTTTAVRSPSPVKLNDTAAANDAVSSILNTEKKEIQEVKFRNIPGITRRPLPAAKMNEKQALEASGIVSPTKEAMSMPAQAGSPPAPLVGTESSPPRPPSVTPSSSSIPTPSGANVDLPMLSQPVRKKLPGPSLFIPRKKPKIS